MRARLIYVIIFLGLALQGEAQRSKCPEIPEGYVWDNPEDYRKDSVFVSECLVWLCQAPLYKSMECRSRVNIYVMEWLAGTTGLTIDVDSRALPFAEENPELLYSFIHGMALYKMKNKACENVDELRIQGLKAVCKLVEREEEMKRSKSVKQLMRMSKSDKKLNNYYQKLVSPKQ
jgi:hypothetical protein